MRKTQLTAIACVLMVMAVACAPAMMTEEEDEVDGEAITITTVFLAYALVASFGLGAVIGAGATYLALSDPSKEDSAVKIDELENALANAEKEKVSLATASLIGMACSIMPSDADMMFFTQNYWDQAMEYQVYDAWTKENIGKYDEYCMRLLAGSGFLNAENTYLTMWANAVGTFTSNVLSQSAKWDNEKGAYIDKLKLSFTWDGKTVSAVNGDESGKLGLTLGQKVTATSDTNVYIDVLENAENYSSSISGTIYVYGTNSSKTIQNLDDGKQYTLNPGANDVENLPAGVYKLPAGATYAGPLISVIGESSKDVEGAVILTAGSDFYIVTSESDSKCRITSSDGSSTTSSKLTIDVEDGKSTDTINLFSENNNLVGFWNEMVETFNQIAENTYTTGAATWKIFDTVEESSPYVHPSSLPVNNTGQTLSLEEKVYLNIHMMAQIKEYYSAHEGDLSELELTFNKENLDLYCYGNVYLNGKLWLENVIFTPYISSTDQHLELGMNTWNGSGFLAVWDQTDNYASWDGNVSTSSPMSPINANYSLEIKKIVKDKTEVSSIDLSRKVVEINGGEVPDVPDPTPMPKVYDTSVLWMAIIIEAGIILVLLGRVFGISAISFVGVAVLLVGIMFPQAISSLILGNFSWGDLVPFGWL